MKSTVDVIENQQGDVLILRLKGRLDSYTSPSLEKRIFQFINNGHSKLLLDLSKIDYIGSSGLRMLLSTAKQLKALSGNLIICSLTEAVLEVIRICGFDHVLQILHSEEEALEKF